MAVTEQEIAIFKTNRYQKGAMAVLEELRLHLGEWILRDWLEAVTGQRNIRSRVSELRQEPYKFTIECNRRAGNRTAYRLVRL
jgi:hypothetical protein